MSNNTLQIRPLHTLSEMQTAVDLQKTYWGTDYSAVIPEHMLYTIVATGGHVLAATDGDDIAAVLIGLVGLGSPHEDVPRAPYIFSKRMVVLPAYRNHGLGYRLKIAQRDLALEQGLNRVVWTFDPLLAPNAYLNLHKLGGVCYDFYRNHYGTSNIGGLSPTGYSDRLQLEWPITAPHVAERAAGIIAQPSVADYIDMGAIVVNPAQMANTGYLTPTQAITDPDDARWLLIEVPPNHAEIEEQAPALAATWRDHNRQTLEACLQSGYTVVDFVRSAANGSVGRVYYVLNRA